MPTMMPKNDYNNTKNEDEKIIKGLFVQKLCSSVLVYDDFADEISQKRQHRVQINNIMLNKERLTMLQIKMVYNLY